MRVRTFGDQDASRQAVAKVCARAVVEVLRLLDAFVGDAAGSPEFMAFREAFGPELLAILQSEVAGPIIAGLDLEADGRASLARAADRLRTYEVPPEVDTLLGRLAWLVEEVPSMARFFGQLYAADERRLEELVNRARALDLERPADRTAGEEIVAELEVLHLWAHPSGRILRGDVKAIARFREVVGSWGSLLVQTEAERPATATVEAPAPAPVVAPARTARPICPTCSGNLSVTPEGLTCYTCPRS